jgi:hypothetical protein
MDNLTKVQSNPVPFKERRKEWMKNYQKTYMKDYYKDKMVTCTCDCIIFPHAVKKHQATLKHTYLLTLKNQSTVSK